MSALEKIKILILHARDPQDPMLHHEFECFVERSNLDSTRFSAMNLTTEHVTQDDVNRVDLVMIGGSGSYSVVTGGFAWHEPLLELMRLLVEQQKPTFASCFGYQALIQALGGTIESDDTSSELGTFSMKLTPEGERDPLFGNMPKHFNAQLGHNDSATAIPDELEILVSSQRCAFQAVRVKGAPIYATQFHPELTNNDNITRYLNYAKSYLKEGETIEDARNNAQSMHQPSPESNSLIRLFLEMNFGD